MALISLLLLFLAIMLVFFRHINTGLLSIAFALVLGRVAGIPDKTVIGVQLFAVPDSAGGHLPVQHRAAQWLSCSPGGESRRPDRSAYGTDPHRHLRFLHGAFGARPRHGADDCHYDGVFDDAGRRDENPPPCWQRLWCWARRAAACLRWRRRALSERIFASRLGFPAWKCLFW